MASIKKRFSFKRDNKISDATTNGSFVDGPAITSTTQVKAVTQKDCHFDRMPPDKGLEEKVLQNRFQYLSSNLPPDDVAIEMNSKGLLTVKEHEEYMSMKRAHTSDSTKSEYLLQCLGRRRAGFLTHFCEILRGIEQASYLADDIIEAYKRAALQMHTYNSRLDRLSNLSLSDPDLHAKGGYGAQECTRCKVLERRIKKLEKQCREFKDQQEVYQNIILPFKPLAEVAQEQLQRAVTEGNQLKELLPSLQEAVTQTTSQISAVQVSLGKINEMLTQEKERMKVKEMRKAGGMRSEGYSARASVISDGSAYTAEGDTEGIYTQRDHDFHGTRTFVSTQIGPHEAQQNDEHQLEQNKVLTESTSNKRRKSESASASQKRKTFLQLRTVRSNDESKSAHFEGSSSTDT